MIQQVEVVYENGVLRPLQPISLAESEHAFIAIVGHGYEHLLNHDLIEFARQEVARMGDVPTIDKVRELLPVIPGSMADSVAAERGEY